MYTSPENIWINNAESYIVKGIFYDCIPIHSNTIITEFSITPELPQALFIDTERHCIGGLYSDSLYGVQSYRIYGRNKRDVTSSIISLIFTRMLCRYFSFSNTAFWYS